jgi:hypothetical protein
MPQLARVAEVKSTWYHEARMVYDSSFHPTRWILPIDLPGRSPS